jgi:hypothetical protein
MNGTAERGNYARLTIDVRVYLSGKIGVCYNNQCIGLQKYKARDNKQLQLWADIVALQ